MVLVQLDVRASELSSKVERKRDLPSDQMPPEHLISAGVKHYANPKLKAPFNAIKKRAERACAEVGFPLLKGWAIPKQAARKLDDVLKTLMKSYVQEADDLERSLPQAFADWESENPGWEGLLKRDRPSPSEIRGRYRFRHMMYRMRPAADDDDDPLNDGMGIARGSLLEAILDDVASNATEILKKSFEGKAQVSGRVMSSIGVLANKLKTFSMVDPLVVPVATMIGEVLGQIGSTCATLSVTHTSALRGLLDLLTDPVMVRRHGSLQVQELAITVDEAQTDLFHEPEPEAVVLAPPPPAKMSPSALATML
ncbi:DUF3150 domain-containing protein [Rhodanobacter sp. FW106-PBR-R2A-1-13]|uniref:DUF3150 domain-containing protein n=1 Tax=Rhodanobacter sp. FW106-PBR-R2A-1-13 TaxID=3454845 RepID=UPI0034E507CA